MNFLLYLVTTLIWGTTWIAIKMQIGIVDPCWSVAYRFILAAAILIIFSVITKKSLSLTPKQHFSLFLQSAFLFSTNYILYYFSSKYLISGLLAVIFASLIAMNILNSRLFFKTRIAGRVAMGAILGLSGLVIVFWSEIRNFAANASDLHAVFLGLSLCLCATLFASFGNMFVKYNQDQQIPLLQSNAIGMSYGALITIVVALFMAGKPNFDWHIAYLSSLLYLSLFGTVFAFGTYITLLNRIGPERASYSFVVTPIIALIISTIFEGFKWLPDTALGIMLILFGNILVLYKPSKKDTAIKTALAD